VGDKVPNSCNSARGAQLNRYGAISGLPLAVAICATWNTTAFAQEISVRQLQQNRYEMILTNQSNLDEREAQAYIAKAAVPLCRGLSPVLGKYRFESKEALGTGVLSREPTSFRFVQEVSCLPVSLTVPSQRAPKPASPEEIELIRADITKMSEEYFHLLAAKKFDAAYSEMREGGYRTGQDHVGTRQAGLSSARW
jgi:hypothetical protein